MRPSTIPALLATLATLATCGAHAQGAAGDYPSRPIRLIVGFPPGGAADIIGRITAQKLSEAIGQQVVVDNRGGAGGVIATEITARAAPDGYTLMLTSTPHAVNPALYRKVNYDPVKDFAPVTMVLTTPMVLGANPSAPFRTAAEMLAHARANPGRLSYGSGGAGSSGHLAMEMLKSMASLDILHVPYKGTGPVINDLIAGQINLTIGSALPMLPQVRSGKLRGLAVTGAKRSSVAPDLPTVAESGVQGYDMTQWFCVIAPAGTPKAVVAKLNAALGRALRLPETRDLFLAQSAEPAPGTPEALGELIRVEVPKWAKLIRGIGVRVD